MSRNGFGFEKAVAKLAGQTVVVAIAIGVLAWLFFGLFDSSDHVVPYHAEPSAQRPPAKSGSHTAEIDAEADPLAVWRAEFPKGDFAQLALEPAAVVDAVERDTIRAIDRPVFQPVAEVRDSVAGREPVVSLTFNNDARAYPLRTLMWHEVVNDTVGGVPVAVTYDPLCDLALVFDRRIGGAVLEFGVTGRLVASNLVLYDRESESWWQQYTGEAVTGIHAGERLAMLPARLDSVEGFAARHPDGLLLIPADRNANPYGRNPYPQYDSRKGPFKSYYQGPYDPAVPPMARVVAVGDRAWSIAYLRQRGRVEEGDLVIIWEPGRLSPLDNVFTSQGRDVGIVTVARRMERGLEEIPFHQTFAFAYHAFNLLGAMRGTPDQVDASWE